MSTGLQKVNIFLKKFLTKQQITDNFLEYLLKLIQEAFAETWQSQGIFEPDISAVQLFSSDTVDTFDLVVPLRGTNGPLGNILNLDADDADNIPFQNTNAVIYSVGLRYTEIESGVETNVRTGEKKYTFVEEGIGEKGEPNSVVDDGDETLTMVVDNVFENGVSNAGRKVLVYLKNPLSDSDTFETLTVLWDGSNNKIETIAAFGQTLGNITVDPADYIIIAKGSTVRRNTDLSLDPDILFLGTVEGKGAGNSPDTFDQSGAVNLSQGLAGITTLFDAEHSLVDGVHTDINPDTITTKPAVQGVQIDTQVNASDEDTPDAETTHTNFPSVGGSGIQDNKWVIRDSSGNILFRVDAHGSIYLQNLAAVEAIFKGDVTVNGNTQFDGVLKSLTDMIYIIDSNADGTNSYKFYNQAVSVPNLLMEILSVGDVNILRDLLVGRNLTVTGDLTVNGTTTTINTAVLDVEDANITINKNGNEASADLVDAGLTVEMSDATDVAIGFDSTLASKMKLGEVGTLHEIVTVAHIQTLLNKTLTASILQGDTQLNDPIREEATDDNVATGANATIAALPSPVVRLINASLTSIGALAAQASGKVITLMNVTGNTVQIENDNGATAAQGILTGTGGALQLLSNSSIILKYDNTTLRWRVIGGTGSGNGGGGLDIFDSENFEALSVADFTKGLNPVFGTAGTFGGTLSDNTATPLAGNQSPKYTAGASSTNDWFKVKTIDLDTKQQNQDVGIIVWVDASLFSKDFKFVAWDEDNLKELTVASKDIIEGGTGKARYSFSIKPAIDTDQISYGFHMTTAPVNGESFEFVDVEFSTNPFVFKNLTDRQYLIFEEAQSAMAERSLELRWSASLTTANFTGDSILEIEDDAGNTRTKFVALKKCTVNIGVIATQVTSNRALGILVNGVVVFNGNDAGTTGNFGTSVNGEVELNVGDFITVGVTTSNVLTASSVLNGAVITQIIISAEADTEHYITPAKSNLTDWIPFTPTFTGFGTVTNKDFYYKQIGDSYHIRGTATNGTMTAVEAQMTLPNSKSIKSGVVIGHGGTFTHDVSATANGGFVLMTGGDAFLNFSVVTVFSGTSSASLTPATGSTMLNNALKFSVDAIVPIEGLSSDATFLAAIPVQKVAYIKDLKTNLTDGGTSSNDTVHTRDLNTIEGDSEIVSLSANQFTLSKGDYDFDIDVPQMEGSRGKAFLYNVTDSTYDLEGANGVGFFGGATLVNLNIKGRISITESKTYEIRHYIQDTLINAGLGQHTDNGVNPQANETYTVVKITRVR